jgi:carotenoid cleavage dioxygenase-like enzyme
MASTTPKYAAGFLSQDRTQDEIALTVIGTLPEWLSGTLLRNGPALFQFPNGSMRHFFDGLALLHRFDFKGNQVTYSSRFLESDAYKRALKFGRCSSEEFATGPKKSLIERISGLLSPRLTDNANVNIAPLSGRLAALTETTHQLLFDPRTLAVQGEMKYTDNIRGQLTTAHPHYDFTRRELINLIVNVSKTCHYQIYALKDGDSSRRLVASLPTKNPAYIHSFAITKRYVILEEFPLLLEPLSLAFSGKAYIENYQWHPERATRFLVIDRDNGALLGTFPFHVAFAFHQINAFERDDEVVVDISLYEDSSIIQAFYFSEIEKPNHRFPRARVERIRINLNKNTISGETLFKEPFEFARLNYRRNNGNCYRYAYGASQTVQPDSDRDFLNLLTKLDTETLTSKTWSSEGCYPGEPVFVARQSAADEDDGIVLSVILNTISSSSFLLCLDGKTFQELARAELPHPLSFGLHGIFMEERNDEHYV